MRSLIQDMLGKCRNGDEACDVLRSNGATSIGSGHFATVWQVRQWQEPSPARFSFDVYRMLDIPVSARGIVAQEGTSVIKVVRCRDNGALLVVKAAMATADIDPLAPKITALIEFGDGSWAVEMERLEPLADTVSGAVEAGITKKSANPWYASKEPLPEVVNASPFLSILQAHMDKYEGTGNHLNWDIHGANVMMRGKQPVVTDPIFFGKEC